MMKKLMLVTLPLLFCVSVVSHILYYFDIRAGEVLYVYKVAFATFQLLGAIWIYAAGTLRKSRIRNLLYLGIGIFWIGQTFILQHWPAGRMLLLVGTITIIVSYSIHFLKKAGKTYLDWLKLTWIILFLILMTIGFLYDRDARLWVGWVFNFNSIILIWLFYFVVFKKEKSGRFELSADRSEVFDYKE